MNVLVVGANGKIGKQLVHLLRGSSEHTVKAMVRKEEQAEAFAKLGVEVSVTSLEDRVEDIAQAARGVMRLFLLLVQVDILDLIKHF